ncbi:hypothetical protein DFS33DRAFT_1425650 [Desarmillaria ectypa]|nr:hypothetical protein DFS33DRAFT_1425650 [Desarmillaria ectypa]
MYLQAFRLPASTFGLLLTSTAPDVAIVHLLSDSLYQATTALVLESVLCGGYLILMFFALGALLRRNRRDRTRSSPRLASVFTILLFLMSTSLWVMDIADVLGPLRAVLADSQGLISFGVAVLISDAIVVWPGALWAFDIKIIAAPLVSLTAGVGYFDNHSTCQKVKDLDRENPNVVCRIRLHLSLLLDIEKLHGLYPTIIIAIVARHQTNWDTPFASLGPLTISTQSNASRMQFVPHTEMLATSSKTPTSAHVCHSVVFATRELESESS